MGDTLVLTIDSGLPRDSFLSTQSEMGAGSNPHGNNAALGLSNRNDAETLTGPGTRGRCHGEQAHLDQAPGPGRLIAANQDSGSTGIGVQ